MDTGAQSTAVEPRESGSVVTHVLPSSDGRHLRKARTKAALLGACRVMLATGDFRPTITAVAKAAGCSIRTAFEVTGGIEKLLLEALDEPTKRAILGLVLREGMWAASDGDQTRILRAVIFGRG